MNKHKYMSSYYKHTPFKFMEDYIGKLKWYQKLYLNLFFRYNYGYKIIIPTNKNIDYKILPNDQFTVIKIKRKRGKRLEMNIYD